MPTPVALPTPPMSVPGDKCSCYPSIGGVQKSKCTNPATVWLVDDKNELMIHSGAICQSCADRILGEWNTAFPDEAWSTVPFVAYVHPFAIKPAETVTVEPINSDSVYDGYYIKVDDIIIAREWRKENLSNYQDLLNDLPGKATRRRESARELIEARGDRQRRDIPNNHCELGDHESTLTSMYCIDWLDLNVCAECYIGHLRQYYPETSLSVIRHLQEVNGLPVDRVISPWQPVEIGYPGQVNKVSHGISADRRSWQIYRTFISSSSGKSREYGHAPEKGILEFVNREQAQSVCDIWNIGDSEDVMPTTPGSSYVFDDSNTVKVRKPADKPINTSRLVGLFAAKKGSE